MAEINIFDFMDRSRDKGLNARVGQSSKALSDLQRGHALQTLTNRGNMERQGLANVGSRANAIIGQGFSGPNDPSFNPDILKRIRDVGLAQQAGSAASSAAGGGIRVPKAGPNTPPRSVTDMVLGSMESGFALPDEAAAIAANKVTDVDEKSVERKIFERVKAGDPSGVPGQIRPTTVKTLQRRKVETKGTPQADKVVEERFPGDFISEAEFEEGVRIGKEAEDRGEPTPPVGAIFQPIDQVKHPGFWIVLPNGSGKQVRIRG